MDATKLIEKTKAEVTCGRALAWVGGKRLVLARSIDGTMVLTDDGKAVAKMLNSKAAATKPTAKATATPSDE